MELTPTSSPILQECLAEFRRMKVMAEKVLNQFDDAQLHVQINPFQNSAAIIVQHLIGNMLSRWTDFLTSDGEKPERNREGEFADRNWSRQELMAAWERSWEVLFKALSELTDNDLQRTVYIRKEPHTVFQAINRQTAHYSLHIGQLMLIGKHLQGDNWQYLTIPPGGSQTFNASKGL